MFREIQQVLSQPASNSLGDRWREEDGVFSGGVDRGAYPLCLQSGWWDHNHSLNEDKHSFWGCFGLVWEQVHFKREPAWLLKPEILRHFFSEQILNYVITTVHLFMFIYIITGFFFSTWHVTCRRIKSLSLFSGLQVLISLHLAERMWMSGLLGMVGFLKL